MTQTQDNTPRFSHGMMCCKAGRVAVGLSCERVDQMCCAWHRIAGAFKPRGLPVLSKFAEHLMDACAWPLADVFWPFNAAGESSALALACASRYRAISTEAERLAFRSTVVASTSPEFVAVFDVLCKAAPLRL